jgi:hypothetical protein
MNQERLKAWQRIREWFKLDQICVGRIKYGLAVSRRLSWSRDDGAKGLLLEGYTGFE